MEKLGTVLAGGSKGKVGEKYVEQNYLDEAYLLGSEII